MRIRLAASYKTTRGVTTTAAALLSPLMHCFRIYYLLFIEMTRSFYSTRKFDGMSHKMVDL